MSAECASVTPCGPAAPVTVLWTTTRVWPATSRSVTAEEHVNVAPVSALTPNSRVPLVKPVLPVQESVLNTSKSDLMFALGAFSNVKLFLIMPYV